MVCQLGVLEGVLLNVQRQVQGSVVLLALTAGAQSHSNVMCMAVLNTLSALSMLRNAQVLDSAHLQVSCMRCSEVSHMILAAFLLSTVA